MAILRVTKYGENILRKKLKPVNYQELAPKLPQLLKDMEETCLAVRGVGLAANQIGLEYRLALILIPESDKENAPLKRYVIINPEILSMRGEKIEEEGCLSLPGLWAEVKRATDVTLKYTDENGVEQESAAKNFIRE